MAATTEEVIRNRGAGAGGGDSLPRTLEERAVTGSQAQERRVGPTPYTRVKIGKEGPPAPGQMRTRDGQTRNADFEKKHPRTSKGRTGGGRFVQSGDQGGVVNTVQTKLGLKSTGKMDATTVQRIRRFQARHGLKVDGIVGHQTIAAMRGDSGAAKVPVGALSAEDKNWLDRLGVRQKGKRGNKKLNESSPPEVGMPRELDEVIEIRRVRGHAVRARELEAPELAEALMSGVRELEELRGTYDPDLHPRDRQGQFRDVLGNLQRFIDVSQDLHAVDSAIRAIPELPKQPRDEYDRKRKAAEDHRTVATKLRLQAEDEHGPMYGGYSHSNPAAAARFTELKQRAVERGELASVDEPKAPGFTTNTTPYNKDALQRSATNGLAVAAKHGQRQPGEGDLAFLKRMRVELRTVAKEAKTRRPKRRDERGALAGGQMELPLEKRNAELRKKAAEWQSDWERKMARLAARQQGGESEREMIMRRSPTAAAEEREYHSIARGAQQAARENMKTREENTLKNELRSQTLSGLAQMIRRDWAGKVNFGAKPFLDAMDTMSSATDDFGQDKGYEIIARFLSNASGWRGPTAKAVKAELRARQKAAQARAGMDTDKQWAVWEAELPARRAAVAARDARASGDLELAERYERRANALAEATGMDAFFRATGKPRAGDGRFRETLPTQPGKAITQEQIARTHVSEDERRREQERELEQETTPPEGGARPTMAAAAA